MKIPSREFLLPGGLVCAPVDVEARAWQEHLVKHPLGVNAIARTQGKAGWNREGWDSLDPPVVTEKVRSELVRSIAALSEGKLRCEVPEFRGKKFGSDVRRFACADCQPPVLQQCGKLLSVAGGVGESYGASIDGLLDQVAGEAGLQVRPTDFHQSLHRLWRNPAMLVGAVVLTVGLDRNRGTLPIARISRADGLRAEFYFEEPNRLRWRTTYRDAASVGTGPQQISFLGEVPRPEPRLGPVSEICIVARRWWESHAT